MSKNNSNSTEAKGVLEIQKKVLALLILGGEGDIGQKNTKLL